MEEEDRKLWSPKYAFIKTPLRGIGTAMDSPAMGPQRLYRVGYQK